ncbi:MULTISPECIES: hypothetical protein [unclassified Crossiella]|uniref:hypothetical protein n=1 Tax=unclassified Crossiella TaxID=2620835 RepID=UPI001FFE934F|nr:MULTISPECIES: hypothetical protein [unclassified Crossiella]MCK2238979.1 hypothetical protein [Crossiella sp. S99.2]MCK2251452.1 hypothetical protein [Crossiella sp. S99.1]
MITGWLVNRALALLGDLVEDFECLDQPDQKQQAFRTRVLNRDLAADFGRWYPGFIEPDQPAAAAA